MEHNPLIVTIESDRLYLNEKPTNFLIQELIPRAEYELYSPREQNSLLRFINPAGLAWLQFTRDFFQAPVLVNNWYWEGRFQLRGYRPPQAGYYNHIQLHHREGVLDNIIKAMVVNGVDIYGMDVGSYYSIHKTGGAFDFTVKGLTANQTRTKIFDNEKLFLQAGLSTLEAESAAPTWVHGDNRPTGVDEILIVRPAA
jgi:hypothetical protein